MQPGAAPTIVALMGSYHRGGVVDTAVDLVLRAAERGGARTAKVVLVDHRVEFCANCRACCARPGPERGRCVLDDDVNGILDELESADGVVLGAPVNFGDVNARTRQFLERMVGYGYWPYHSHGPPRARRPAGRKPAVLVTSSAAPGPMTRLFARPLATLRRMASLLGARPVASVVVGLVDGPPEEYRPSERTRRACERAGTRLAARARAAAGSA